MKIRRLAIRDEDKSTGRRSILLIGALCVSAFYRTIQGSFYRINLFEDDEPEVSVV